MLFTNLTFSAFDFYRETHIKTKTFLYLLKKSKLYLTLVIFVDTYIIMKLSVTDADTYNKGSR